MINDKDSIQLAEFCFDACEVVNTAAQRKNTGDLNGSIRTGLENSERYFN